MPYDSAGLRHVGKALASICICDGTRRRVRRPDDLARIDEPGGSGRAYRPSLYINRCGRDRRLRKGSAELAATGRRIKVSDHCCNSFDYTLICSVDLCRADRRLWKISSADYRFIDMVQMFAYGSLSLYTCKAIVRHFNRFV